MFFSSISFHHNFCAASLSNVDWPHVSFLASQRKKFLSLVKLFFLFIFFFIVVVAKEAKKIILKFNSFEIIIIFSSFQIKSKSKKKLFQFLFFVLISVSRANKKRRKNYFKMRMFWHVCTYFSSFFLYFINIYNRTKVKGRKQNFKCIKLVFFFSSYRHKSQNIVHCTAAII